MWRHGQPQSPPGNWQWPRWGYKEHKWGEGAIWSSWEAQWSLDAQLHQNMPLKCPTSQHQRSNSNASTAARIHQGRQQLQPWPCINKYIKTLKSTDMRHSCPRSTSIGHQCWSRPFPGHRQASLHCQLQHAGHLARRWETAKHGAMVWMKVVTSEYPTTAISCWDQLMQERLHCRVHSISMEPWKYHQKPTGSKHKSESSRPCFYPKGPVAPLGLNASQHCTTQTPSTAKYSVGRLQSLMLKFNLPKTS